MQASRLLSTIVFPLERSPQELVHRWHPSVLGGGAEEGRRLSELASCLPPARAGELESACSRSVPMQSNSRRDRSRRRTDEGSRGGSERRAAR